MDSNFDKVSVQSSSVRNPEITNMHMRECHVNAMCFKLLALSLQLLSASPVLDPQQVQITISV